MRRHAPRTCCSFLRREVPRSARARRPAIRGRSSHPIELDRVSQVANAVLWIECSRSVSRETHFRPSDHDDGGRRREQIDAAQYDMLVNTSEPADGVAMLVEFLRSAATFQCNRCPPGSRSGKHHAASGPAAQRPAPSPRPTGATRRTTARSSARPRTTLTRAREPQRGYRFLEERRPGGPWARRGRCAGPAERRQGRCQAAQRPTPMSTTRAARGSNSPITAQFSRCRSQIRDASRGPSNPRSTPDDVSNVRVAARPWADRPEYPLGYLRRLGLAQRDSLPPTDR